MLIQHQHRPEEFDPGYCRACARQAGLLDHSGGGILLAVVALLI